MSRRPTRSSTSITFWYWTVESPLMITGRLGFAALYWRNRLSSSAMVTGNVSRKMVPSDVMVMALVCGFASVGAALALGRLTLMPCAVAVVMMIKMIMSTYARSSMGVMLMSS